MATGEFVLGSGAVLFKWLSTSGVLLFHSSVFDLSQLMLSNCGQFSALSPVPAIGRPDVIVENEDVISKRWVSSQCASERR
ncbi:hypothetical protein NP493_2070g00016 [Ridgeia piscesae]|uniref:Uncharacterized protein n=1 Tax=Ridgeia piscesae TaxID=27915 RepID=A0AAD9JMD4_RIDPI|nr:hypothetical protein NP493_2070g00016 [Ridgeia piscesae]